MERSVAVIGAGAAGLVSARELLFHGHKVVVFEQNSRIGGTWVYDPRTEHEDELGASPTRTRIHTSLYESLRTNLPRECMSFLDFPFTGTTHGDGRRFPGYEEVLTYLDSFARHFNLLQHVRFSTRVSYVGLEKKVGPNWLVKSIHASGGEMLEVFEAVVVCNGHYSQPRVAQIPGIERWSGKQIHSHNYRTPEPFKDKVVAVIGNAPSGRDISRDIAHACKHVFWCARAWEEATKFPLKQTNISKHPMIIMADEDGTVHFEDGASAVVDVILHCTGYLYDFPFLDTGDYVTVEDNRVGPLYKHVFPPALSPGLSFVGLTWKMLPFPVCELQAKWIASVLGGDASLPSVKEMEDDVLKLYEEQESKGVPKRYTHLLGVKMFEYGNWLAEASKSSVKLEEWRKDMYAATVANMKSNPDGYRDEWIDEDFHRHVKEIETKILVD